MSERLPWYHENPFIQTWQVGQQHIDHYQHVNNVAYLGQQELLAWAHSNHLGLSFSDYAECDRGMVIRRHELDYFLPCHLGDVIECGTWIIACDNTVSLTRQFQFVCTRRKQTVYAAKTQFICVSVTTGAPKRMPEKFREIYGQACVGAQ
ncbi:acyl-CoA thioesterase [Alteromonas aestuariivivens]|uniref:Acyl-CoA thioesterase n=1 Tax=Alteromonas aestuariivivens TaxID=1938339 RepID=A0A3D8M634_9ALTE|nr:thioesterase family protein [Alteromonas aestuariivivens]RDV24622.1 acyl-CoA thioesterase [Alteromonas aestuariivivens]